MRNRIPMMAAAVAASLGGMALGARPANAGVWNFSFGPAAYGTFTTGAAAVDPGYFLITGLTFTLLTGADQTGHPFSLTNALATDLEPGAAYDPITGAFLNHYAGGTYDDIGLTTVTGALIEGTSFAQYSDELEGQVFSTPDSFLIVGRIAITPQAVPTPEPATLALLGMGTLGIAATRRKRAVP